MMDSLDAGITMDNIILAVEAIKPYVLSWPLTDEEEDGEAETTVLAVMRREGGILWPCPQCFFHSGWWMLGMQRTATASLDLPL